MLCSYLLLVLMITTELIISHHHSWIHVLDSRKMMKILGNLPLATNMNTWKEKIKRGLRQLSTGATGKNILPVFEKLLFQWLKFWFFPLHQQLGFHFSISFTVFKENKSFVLDRSRRLWNFLVPPTWQPDPESGLDGLVCFLFYLSFICLI